VVRVEIPEEDKRPEVIRDALRGRVARVPQSLAFALVGELDIPSSQKRDIIREALQDPALDPPVRVQAARSLAQLEPDLATPELVRVLEEPDTEEVVAATAASVLGQVGEPDNLDQLQRTKESATSDYLRQRAAFAEAMIAHRYGLTDREVELPAAESQPPPQAVGALQFISRSPGRDRRRRALEGVQREFPRMNPGQQDVYEIQCGPRLIEVVVSRDLPGGEGMQALAQRPALPAVVAVLNEETEEFYPNLVALSSPQGQQRVSLLLTRLDGEPVYMGEGSVGDQGAEFEMRAANTAGIPRTAFKVRATRSGVEISGISDRRAVTASRSPERIERP
jgi:HEAT repeats